MDTQLSEQTPSWCKLRARRMERAPPPKRAPRGTEGSAAEGSAAEGSAAEGSTSDTDSLASEREAFTDPSSDVESL
eukprot:8719600-Lingulodinium_polyedra.AAC.1